MQKQNNLFLHFMSKITSSFADYQTFPMLFELEPVAGKKVTVDFTAPELSSLGGLALVREYEKSSSCIIERIESCIKDPRREPMVIHSQTEMLRKKWKHTQIIVRGDSRFCSHDFMDWATDRRDGIHFITGLAGNVKLKTPESLNSKMKSFRAQLRGVSDLPFFMFRLSKIFG